MSERSLPDQLFFPIVVLLAVTMVVLALRPFADRKPSGPVSGAGRDALNLTIEGDELYRWALGRPTHEVLDVFGQLLRVFSAASKSSVTSLPW